MSMRYRRKEKTNVKALVILAVVIIVLGCGDFVARDIRRSILSARDLAEGQAAFDKQDWNTARKCLREYLGRNPDDLAMLKKYARACLSCRPITAGNVKAAIGAYRQVMRRSPDDEVPYMQLARLYIGRNPSELEYIAERRLERAPDDLRAPIWLGEARVQLKKLDEAREGLKAFVERLEKLKDETHAEYAQACAILSAIAARSSESDRASTAALDWLMKAVEYDKKSVEALVYRARF